MHEDRKESVFISNIDSTNLIALVNMDPYTHAYVLPASYMTDRFEQGVIRLALEWGVNDKGRCLALHASIESIDPSIESSQIVSSVVYAGYVGPLHATHASSMPTCGYSAATNPALVASSSFVQQKRMNPPLS